VSSEDRSFVLVEGLRLDFHKAPDRWVHALSVTADEPPRVIPLAAAIESKPWHDDPRRVVSPVYQDLQNHPAPEGDRLLLTGQATPHHFSAVVTAYRRDPIAVIAFDIADRCRAPIAFLAATYLAPLGSSALIDASPEGITWGGSALGRGRLEFKAGGGGTVVLAEAGRQATRVQALARLDPATHTQRLIYSWCWTPPA
jgi:hypothetical protein